MRYWAGLVASLSIWAGIVQAQPSPPDDFDCLVIVIKSTAGGLVRDNAGLSEEQRKREINMMARLNRAFGYFVERNDSRSRATDFRSELERRFMAIDKLDLDAQTKLTMVCVERSDRAMLSLLDRAKGKQN